MNYSDNSSQNLKWLHSSTLQKAIRRGWNDIALQSGLYVVGINRNDVASRPLWPGGDDVCPVGLKYIDYLEAPNKKTPFGTWMQWRGTVECQ